ncbi:hypothetical protein AGLY_015671 [Aphis glycines]|uniref:Uncharacterized protein n=1 Tax=Aphis glycines TaxID=307491 RepID=A0A6G0T1E6_APHGL|nr:hypothetical protein AGLY_015671 [Aphis glycines]
MQNCVSQNRYGKDYDEVIISFILVEKKILEKYVKRIIEIDKKKFKNTNIIPFMHGIIGDTKKKTTEIFNFSNVDKKMENFIQGSLRVILIIVKKKIKNLQIFSCNFVKKFNTKFSISFPSSSCRENSKHHYRKNFKCILENLTSYNLSQNIRIFNTKFLISVIHKNFCISNLELKIYKIFHKELKFWCIQAIKTININHLSPTTINYILG